jgi:cytochrome c-type biogenesis protein CcmH/NrfG
MKDSDVLRAARQMLLSQDKDYICHAIEWVDHASCEQKEDLPGWVLAMLAPHVSYERWLLYTHPKLWGDTPQPERSGKARQARLAWLDWMIAECEKEEVNGLT